MTVIPTADDLRTLNLAYRHMQQDFRTFAPELFRDNEPITTDSDGYLNLPTYVYEVERIEDGNQNKLYPINLELKNIETGYYFDGMQTTGANDGKRRIMVRSSGTAKANTAYTVHYLKEYDDLSATNDTPYPFTGKAYLDMLTTLQAYYWLIEQGKERVKEADRRFREYKKALENAQRDYVHDEPEYGITTSMDAGDRRTSPILNVSTS